MSEIPADIYRDAQMEHLARLRSEGVKTVMVAYRLGISEQWLYRLQARARLIPAPINAVI